MTVQLGLIGENISKSRAPRLHEYLGKLSGLDVDYRPMDTEGQPHVDLMAKLRHCAATGFSGVNVTHPFKQRAAAGLTNLSPGARKVGSVNTVTFDGAQMAGTNTDYTGFKRAYAHVFSTQPPGRVLIIGAGGVSHAIAAALTELGAEEIRIFDIVQAQSEHLAATLRADGFDAAVTGPEDLPRVARGADGLVNGTPIGMHKHPGLPLDETLIGPQKWAFEAVYTPLRTEFVVGCENRGLAVMTGFELFLFQGLDAFECFTGVTVDADAVIGEVRTWMAD